MTPFDEYISNQPLQMMKLFIPFLPPQNQRMFAVYVKFLELRYTLSFFRGMRQKEHSPENIFDTIKPYMSPSDAESFDQMMNMMSMMNMMQEMQNMSDGEFDPMSMMAGMFAQDDNTRPQKEGELHDRLD
jgi:hypothetical protein